MGKIKLRDYQAAAVRFAEKIKYSLFCMRVGSGKTMCALFSLRSFINSHQIDKAVIGCTKSSVPVFIEEFKNVAKLNVKHIEDPDEFLSFLTSKEKVCIVKHSMFEKIGNDLIFLKKLENISENLNIALVIDEAHKMQNPDGVAHEAFQRMSEAFNRILMYTATPYSSCLSQFYGLIHLIYPDLWKSKREFFNRYIDEVTIRDPKTYRVVRKEKVRYKNLKEFRKIIEPFTYFFYPPVKLVHVEHHTRLKSYEDYDKLCQGVIDDKTQEKLDKIRGE